MRYLALASIITLLWSSAAHAEPAITSVNKTNTVRCGYVEYMPGLVKDMKTNAWTGFEYEIIQAVMNRLELKAEFTTQTGWGTVVADLNAKKFDMLCNSFWVHPNVGKYALFSRAVYFQPVFVIARADDTRFNAKTNLNDPKLKMAALDGDNPVNIAKADFPQAELMLLPAMTDFSQVAVSVADKKADFTILDANSFGVYNKNNPGKLKIVSPEKPIRTYPAGYAFGAEDIVLRDAVNAALDELILDGTIDRILDKYDEYPNAYYRAVVNYRSPYKK